MTPIEFKAWFEGFTEALDERPSAAQWKRIKDRVAEIDGKPVTQQVFVDRYWPPYVPTPYWYDPSPLRWVTSTCGWSSAAGGAVGDSLGFNTIQGHGFDSSFAMKALGVADAALLQA